MPRTTGFEHMSGCGWATRFVLPALVALLAACGAPPKETPKPAVETPPEVQSTETTEAPVPPPPPPPRQPTAAERNEAQGLAKKAIELLNGGDEATARRDLERALALDPENKIASSLMRQITTDPIELLGSQSFTHRVQKDESLSMLAARYLDDMYMFYALARYNGIKVPKHLSSGQDVRIPGTRRAPPPPQANAPDRAGPKAKPGVKPVVAQQDAPPPQPAVSPGESAYQQGLKLIKSDRDKAYDSFVQAVRLDGQHQQARAQADKLRSELIQHHTRLATTALRRDQDARSAIRHWDRVLQLDPDNASAKANREQAVVLAKKIGEFEDRK